MSSSLVDRATSSLLIGPDWAMNTEICEMLNRDLGQAKDVVKGIKRRLKSKNPKVQFLALTLLETVIKNCGDIVHMHVAEKDILVLMVKIVRKKPDFHVREKILVLIDTWQEAFGGPRARYPQYYAAYQELLHSGAVFPQRPERSALVLTNSHVQLPHNPDHQQDAPESSTGSDFPILSLTEVQNARGIMDVLAEMLNALDPANRDGLKEEVIVDLVEQCRSYKRRVFHLVNTTSDEELLSLGLALNDDLQRLLAKHDAIAAGIAVRQEKPKSPPALVDIGGADNKTHGTSLEPNGSSNTGTTIDPFQQLLLTNGDTNGSTNPPAKVDPHMDLLSWDDDASTTENPLALVPINEPLAPASDQTALALFNSFPQNNTNSVNSFDSHSSHPGQEVHTTSNGLHMSLPDLHSNGNVANAGTSQLEQLHYMQGSQLNPANPMLSGHATQGFNLQQQQQQAPPSLGVNDQDGGAFPPPPWEAQPTQDSEFNVTQPQPMGRTQVGVYPQLIQNNQMGGDYPQTMQGPQPGGVFPQTMQNPQAGLVYPQMMQSPQTGGIYPQMMQSHLPDQRALAMQNTQMQVVYPYSMQGIQHPGMQLQHAMQGSQLGGYAFAQQTGVQFYDQMRPAYQFTTQTEISQRMYGLSMSESGGQMSTNPSNYHMSTSSLPLKQQPMKASKPEDKLFGDLVNFSKVKQNKP